MIRLLSIATTLLLTLGVSACGQTKSSDSNKGKKKEASGSDADDSDGGSESGEGNGKKNPSNGASVHTVLVIDQGFDVEHPVFKDKIAATYTLDCPKPKDRTKDYAGKSFAAMKKMWLAELDEPDDCKVTEGIKFKRDPKLDKIASKREAWNAAILGKGEISKVDDADTVLDVLSGGEDYVYHGTATAGLIAYQNPDVRLVLVEIVFYGKELQAEMQCIAAADHKNYLKIMADPEYQEAYAKKSVSGSDEKLFEIQRENKVTVTNFSGGGLPRAELAQLYADLNCPKNDLAEQYRLEDELSNKRYEYREKQGLYEGVHTVDIQSAGNSSAKVDSPADGTCQHTEIGHVVVGAYDADRQRSEFSNYGKCVTVYSLGTAVVTAAPDGFLTLMNGTSFSAPLTTRHVTLKYPATMSRDDIVKNLIAERDAKRYLPNDTWPLEVAWVDSKEISSYSLTSRFSKTVAPANLWTPMRWKH